MWKPGSSKPTDGSSSRTSPNGHLSSSPSNNDTVSTIRSSTGTSTSTSSPRKRLSGSTMNMRFMKRRKDAINSNNNNKSKEGIEKQKTTVSLSSSSTEYDNKHSRIQQQQHEEKVVDMDDDDYNNDNNNHIENELSTSSDSDYYYVQGTAVDMYGIGASLIGRRSFRGFNPGVERIWKDSKESLSEKFDSSDRNYRTKHKLSDEELLLRYKDSASADDGSGGRMGIGSLDKKTNRNNNKKQR